MKTKFTHGDERKLNPSPSVIVPYILEHLEVNSVIDVGCGVGNWLKCFHDNGVRIITGVDGEYIDRSKLVIDETNFITKNLEREFELDSKYDLAISLEVAEHLSNSASKEFVKSLVNLSDVILFSAAIPLQGGQNHINEQWPSYWQALFQEHEYSFHDILRPVFWNDNRISYYYRQNMFIVTKNSVSINFPDVHFQSSSIVHPDIWIERNRMIESGRLGILFGLKVLSNGIIESIKYRFKR
jgi:SAM-dependent methyltransferase